MPQAQLAESGAPFADAAHAIFGGAWAAKAIAAVALISALGSLNGFNLVNSDDDPPLGVEYESGGRLGELRHIARAAA